MIKTAWSQGVRYNAEFWYVGQENWQETLRENNAFLREKFQRGAKSAVKGIRIEMISVY